MNFLVSGLLPKKFAVYYKASYDDGLYTNYNSGTPLPLIESSYIVWIRMITCNTFGMDDDVKWMELLGV